jgi:hypothetical protein
VHNREDLSISHAEVVSKHGAMKRGEKPRIITKLLSIFARF